MTTKKYAMFMKLVYCLLITVSLVACSKQSSRITQVVIPDSLQQLFEQNDTMIKYMTDEGIPVVERILAGSPDITVAVNREFINVAVQDSRRLIRHFVLKNGDVVKLVYDKDGYLFLTHERPEDEGLPYDENYESLRDSILFKGNRHAFDEFSRYWLMLEMNRMTSSIDGDLLRDLETLQRKSIQDFRMEKAFLDSLESAGQISSYVAGFYHLLITFDSIRVLSYPQFSFNSLVAPSAAMGIAKPEVFDDPRHLVFYDDCVETHYRKMFTRNPLLVYAVSNPDSLYTTISEADIKDRNIKVKMLLHHVIYVCENSPPEECRQMKTRFNNDAEVDELFAEEIAARFK